jgi:tetratricopeptide (TPR) repeat protein
MPALGFAAQLDRAAHLHKSHQEVLDNPRDPVKRRNLGRAYLEMDPTPEGHVYNEAIQHLEAAIELDPGNETGAKFDAQVDLAILSIPESPDQSVNRLFQLQTEDEDDHRKLEIQYYMAVAHFVMEEYSEAKKLLREFETNDKSSPYYDSEWTPQALGLLQYIKQLEQ